MTNSKERDNKKMVNILMPLANELSEISGECLAIEGKLKEGIFQGSLSQLKS